MKMNTALSSGSETLPGNTVSNPKEDLKGITTRSGTAYQGPTIPTTSSSLPKVVERETETKTPIPNSEPVVAPVSASNPNQKPSIPYPSKLHDQKLRDKANDQKEKFFQIYQDLNFNISFAYALILMPKFGPTIKTLLTNKDKLSELAKTPLNEHCLTVLLKKFLEKLGDPDKFLIPCDFPGMAECLALADLGASINLMPLSVWNKLSLLKLSPTCMTLELTDHSISRPVRVVKDVFVKEYSQEVLGFFDVIVSGNPTPYYDPIVSTSSLTLTPFEDYDFLLEEVDAFLALEDDLTSPKVDQSYFDPKRDILLLEAFLNDDPSLPPPNQGNYLPQDLPPHLEYAFLEGNDKLPVIIANDLSDEKKTALITILMEDDFELAVQLQRRVNPKIHDVIKKEVLKLFDTGLIYPISDSPWVSLVYCIPKKGGFTVVENEENELIPTRLVTGWRVCIDYHQEKTTFMCPYETFACRCMPFGLCNAPGRNSFQTCLSHLEKMLKRCEDTNLYLNWEKSYIMVKEGSVLDHKISKNGIEVDKAKVEVISKLPHPTIIKGAVLGQRQEKYFRPIQYASKTMTKAESNYTTTEKEMLAVMYAFKKFQSYLIMNKSIMYMDHSALKYLFAKKDSKARLLRWVLLLQEFKFKSSGGVYMARKPLTFSRLATMDPPGDIMARTTLPRRCLTLDSIGPLSTVMPTTYSKLVTFVNVKERFHNEMKCLKIPSKFVKFLTFKTSTSWGRSRLHEETNIYSRLSTTCRNGFGTPHAIISDRETHFCNDQFVKVMLKYGVTHCLATAYYPQTSGQVEVSNRGLKRILERTVGENCASWSNKLDDALWAFRTAYKTPIGLKIFSGKLKTRWFGPFTITHVFPYGTIELSQTDGPNFKVNGHRLNVTLERTYQRWLSLISKHSPRTNEFEDWVKLSDPKQAPRKRNS
nr:reverse transcriptase domain-containing protein [Tanacetum cinerariifolium]